MNRFTVFYKSGGGDAIRIVDKYWKKVTIVFKKMSEIEFSKETLQFHIEIRVDGEYLTFDDVEGCNHLRFMKKKNVIANSISFGSNIYSNETILSDFLQKNLLLAFEQMVNKLKKEKIDIDSLLLMNKLKEYIAEEFR
jgi:hypothetical protein